MACYRPSFRTECRWDRWKPESMKALLGYAEKLVSVGGAVAAYVFLPGLILTSIFDITTRRFLQLGSTPLQELTWHFFFRRVFQDMLFCHDPTFRKSNKLVASKNGAR